MLFTVRVDKDDTLIGKVLESAISVSFNGEEHQSDTVRVFVCSEETSSR